MCIISQLTLCRIGDEWGWSLSRPTFGEKGETGYALESLSYIITFTTVGNLEALVNPFYMSLDWEGKPESKEKGPYPVGNPTH